MRATGAIEAVAVMLAVGAVGCGGGPTARTLTDADVTGLPAGTAIGTTFSGAYAIQSSSIEACTCRVGSCGNVLPAMDIAYDITQQDGALSVIVLEGNRMGGGVDADGSFKCGGAGNFDQPTTYGDIHELLQGSFTISNGKAVGMRFEADRTFTGTLDTAPCDCDVVESGTAVNEGALPGG